MRSILKWCLAVYVVLLGLSWFVQYTFPVQELPGVYEETVTLMEGEPHRVFYHQLESGRTTNRPVLVILPDIYFDYDKILPIAEQMKDSYRVIIPDLKSFQKRETKDGFTLDRKVEILNELIQELEIDQYHLAGHAYGGLAAVKTAVRYADRVKSLSLIGSLGVQELRFLGNHRINRTLYTLTKPFLNFYKYAFPHFGRYHQQGFTLDYVDAMIRFDQREIREDLKSVSMPTLILHSDGDQFIPLSVARENYRLIPQSEINIIKGAHERIWEKSEAWSQPLKKFLEQAEKGEAAGRNQAELKRIEEAGKPFNSDNVEALSGKALIVMMILIMVFTIFSEDLSAIAAGLLAAGGILPFQYAVLSCFLGILMVDVNIFWLGKNVGNPILKRIPFRWLIKEDDLNRASNLFEMYGMELLFVARFIPGARFPTYFAAGLLKTGFKSFFIYFLLSIIVWTPLMVGLSVLIGQPMMQYLSIYQDYALWILLLTILFIYLIVKFLIPLTTVRGRRRMFVKWARFWQRREH